MPGERLSLRRRYRAAHNVGHFRFVEFTGAGGTPQGELAPYGEVLVAFDPSLRDGRDLREVPVRRVAGPEVEEVYTVDGNGMVEVAVTDVESGYAVRQQLGAQV